MVVTDTLGRPVGDLRSADFELRESGIARPLSSVEYRGGAHATRALAFLLDEFHVSPGESTERARAALSRFVDEALGPQDVTAVLRPLEPAATLQFTRDRAPLRAAIAAFSGRQGDPTPRGDFETQFIGRAPEAVRSARAQIVAAALSDIAIRTGGTGADRAVLVVVSDGFPGDRPGTGAGRAADLQGVVRAASRLQLTIYAFSPGGTPRQDPDAGTPARSDAGAAMLEWLTAQTGGRAVRWPDDLGAGFARLSRDLASSYTLTWPPLEADGRFHRIELRTKRPRLEVRTPPGYWAAASAGTAAPTSLPRMRALHRSPLVETWVGLVPRAGPGATPGPGAAVGPPQVVVSWEARPGAGRAVTARLQARASDGAPLFSGDLSAVRRPAGSAPDSARFEARGPRVELDIEILDANGKRLDLETRDVDVPDLRQQHPGPVLWFPQILRARAFREYEAMAANPGAAPSSSRRFSRSDRLLIRVPAVDASGEPVAVSARLLNALGQPMREIEATGANGEGIGGMAQFGLPLSWLGPGQYLIEVRGTNANGTATERMAFTLDG